MKFNFPIENSLKELKYVFFPLEIYLKAFKERLTPFKISLEALKNVCLSKKVT